MCVCLYKNVFNKNFVCSNDGFLSHLFFPNDISSNKFETVILSDGFGHYQKRFRFQLTVVKKINQFDLGTLSQL